MQVRSEPSTLLYHVSLSLSGIWVPRQMIITETQIEMTEIILWATNQSDPSITDIFLYIFKKKIVPHKNVDTIFPTQNIQFSFSSKLYNFSTNIFIYTKYSHKKLCFQFCVVQCVYCLMCLPAALHRQACSPHHIILIVFVKLNQNYYK